VLPLRQGVQAPGLARSALPGAPAAHEVPSVPQGALAALPHEGAPAHGAQGARQRDRCPVARPGVRVDNQNEQTFFFFMYCAWKGVVCVECERKKGWSPGECLVGRFSAFCQ